jgi:TorA maturation chaperone TorD
VSAPAFAAPVTLHRALAPEESARADFYALLANLLNATPGAGLLAALAGAELLEGDPELSRAWQGLVHAASAMDVDAATDEYDALFAGVGKSAVSIYAGHYTGAPAVDHPRIRIQAALAELGLGRDERATEPEDHIAGLLEAMRVLVAGGAGRAPATIADQRRFFREHVEQGAAAFFKALAKAPQSNFYRHVAAVGAAFVSLESLSFQLD